MIFEGTKTLFYDWGGANEWLFLQVNSLSTDSWYNAAMLNISKLGELVLVPYYLLAVIAFVVLAYIYRKAAQKGGNKQFLAMWFGIVLVLIVGYVCNRLSIQFLKDYFSYPRPYVELAGQGVIHLEPLKGTAYGNQSFPSGHTAQICVLIFSLWPALYGAWRWAGFFIVLAVMWSRLALGVHYPADVVGALLLTSLEIFLVRNLLYRGLHKMFGLKC